MATLTKLKLGPRDHDRPLSREEYQSAEYQEGYRYELIHGRLYVSPLPRIPHDRTVRYIDRKLDDYSREHPEVMNMVSTAAEVHVPPESPDADSDTYVQPDIAAYKDVPKRHDLQWEDISPFLVVEVLSPNNPEKDLERNVVVYHQVPTIKEYWIVDGITDPERPSMTVFRRWGRQWRKIAVPFDTVYTTPLLPGFELRMNPWA